MWSIRKNRRGASSGEGIDNLSEQSSLLQGENGVKLTVDTREKARTFNALKELKLPYVRKTLPAGDFETAKCIAERKTIRDLIQAIRQDPKKKGQLPRFFKQMEKLADYAEENDKIPFLFVSGNLRDTEAWFKQHGLKLNRNSIMGALSSAAVRYGIHVFAWFDDDKDLIYCLNSTFERVRDGKYMLPHRRPLVRQKNKKVALWCTILRITPMIARQLVKKYKSFDEFLKVLRNKPRQLEYIRGVGPGTVQKWRKLLLE